MWHTSRGDRTLSGPEAALVSNAIDTMIDALLVHVDEDFDDDDVATDCVSGIAVYDRLSASQRIAVLHDAATYLLTDTPHAMDLSATSEATVAAVFVEIRDQVAIEIDLLGDPRDGVESWRELVWSAFCSLDRTGPSPCEGDGEPDDALSSLTKDCQELRVWERVIDRLADAILWDRDFEMADGFLDVDPGLSHHRRRLLGISDDYFTSVAPDPLPEEVYRFVTRTRDIVRTKPR